MKKFSIQKASLKKANRRSITTCILAVSLTTTGFSGFSQKKGPADYVNPFIGASTSVKAAGNYAGLGKTFPGAATPFGMVQVSPNTITGGDNGSGYSYEHQTMEGFALTQMSGVGWYGDLGNFLVMPSSGPLKTNSGKENETEGYRSHYDKKSESASAGYYSVLLTDHQIKAELTATPHCGIMKFTFPEHEQSRIQIDLARRVGGTAVLQYVKVVDEFTIEGWMKCTPDGGGWGNGNGHADYILYFYSKFSKPLKNFGIWSADIPDQWSRKLEDVESSTYQKKIAESAVFKGLKEKQGKHLGFYTEFATLKNEEVLLKTGISFNSISGAHHNLDTEINNWNFSLIRLKAHNLWNKALSKITVEGGTEDEKHSFYTALYHTMIDPRSFQDVDGHYPGGDGQAHVAKGFTKRTVFSGWDVFRSQMPLQTLINPAIVNDLLNSQITLAAENQKRYFDRWEMLNAYSGCMIGNPTLSVLADAYHKGIRNYNLTTAYQMAKNTATKFSNGAKGFSGPPYSISNTLEYAYFDWCMAQLAKATVNKTDVALFSKKAKAYRLIFDRERGWFRPKKDNGDWEKWPDLGRLQEWYGTTESNPYQQGWFVPHDIPGLINLLGGREKALSDLTAFFDQTPDDLLWNDFYNHANEPVHHVPYLFNRLGSPWLTQKWTRKISKTAYQNKVQGLVGNEDAGQMSAWYVLAASGIAQICPGDNRYEITSPVFQKVSIALDPRYTSGKQFTVIAKHNSPSNIYIQSAVLNGKSYHKSYIDYTDIASGSRLELVMGNKPNRNWGK